MSKRRVILPIALVVFVLAAGIFFLFQTRVGKTISGGFEIVLSPFQKQTHQAVTNLASLHESPEIVKLQSENRQLTQKLAKMQDLTRENQALQDQFKTQVMPTHMLIPASVIGDAAFIPGVSPPDRLTIDKGEKDGVIKGNAVVYQNNLVGQVTAVFPHAAAVTLVTNSASSLTVRTAKTKALGIAKGQENNGILLDNVTLSDTLETGDIVESKGQTAVSGVGIPPDLVIGKILAVHKRSSSLFQTADIQSLIDFSRLETVFVVSE